MSAEFVEYLQINLRGKKGKEKPPLHLKRIKSGRRGSRHEAKKKKVRQLGTGTMQISIMCCMNTAVIVSCAGGLSSERGNVRRTYAEQSGDGETALLA